MLLQDDSGIVRRYLNRPFARSAFEAQRIYLAFNSDVLFKVVDFRQMRLCCWRSEDRWIILSRCLLKKKSWVVRCKLDWKKYWVVRCKLNWRTTSSMHLTYQRPCLAHTIRRFVKTRHSLVCSNTDASREWSYWESLQSLLFFGGAKKVLGKSWYLGNLLLIERFERKGR